MFENMSGDSGKKYIGFQQRAIIFICIILKRYNIILFRYCLQENDNIILIIGTSNCPVFLRCKLLKCVQVKERLIFFAFHIENPLEKKCRLEKKILFSDKGRIYLLALTKQR